MTSTKRFVFTALDNAMDNGHTTFAMYDTPITVAYDLVEFDADLENETPEFLVPHILAWRESKCSS